MSNPIIVRSEQQVEAQTSHLLLPRQFVATLTQESTTPSVKNVTRFLCRNLISVDVTNFKDGQEGQEIILIGDGNTNVIEGLYIQPGGGSHLLEAGYVYRFILINGVWLEFNYGGTSATAGGGTGGITGLTGPPGSQGEPGIDGASAIESSISIDVDSIPTDTWTAGSIELPAKKVELYKVSSNVSGAIRLYFNADNRDADILANRLRTVNPGPGFILAEVWLSVDNDRAQWLSPVPTVYNADEPRGVTIYWAAKQTMTGDSAINFDLIFLPLEI